MNWIDTVKAILAGVIVSTSFGLSQPAKAECPGQDAVATMATKILAGEPSGPLAVETMEDGLCAQDKLVTILSAHWGAPIGYKAGLTSKAAQDRFGVFEPIRGVLFMNMMLEPGATVPAGYGALPRFEADLIVVAADAGINDAKTPEEVLPHLSAVHPFIELPDLVMGNPKDLNGPVIASINVGARYGVLGKAIAPVQSAAFLASLADMTVTVTDQNGKELATAKGSSVLDHPLNSVLWLIQSGVRFEAGDMISVGSIGPLLPPAPGLTATVTYNGLPGDPGISVSFR